MPTIVLEWDNVASRVDNVGHSSLGISDDGHYYTGYLSFHPRKNSVEKSHDSFLGFLGSLASDVAMAGQPEYSEYDDDLEKYKMTSREVIYGLDSEQIDDLILQLKRNPRNYYNLLVNNCACATAAVLKVAFAEHVHDMGVFDRVSYHIRNGSLGHIFSREEHHSSFNLVEFFEEAEVKVGHIAARSESRIGLGCLLLEAANEVHKVASWRPSTVIKLAKYIKSEVG